MTTQSDKQSKTLQDVLNESYRIIEAGFVPENQALQFMARQCEQAGFNKEAQKIRALELRKFGKNEPGTLTDWEKAENEARKAAGLPVLTNQTETEV